MKTKYIFIKSVLFLIFGLFGCDTTPEIEDFPNERVNFTYEVVGDYELDFLVGSTIRFNNISEGVGNYTWDFGDGTPKVTEKSPSHIYQTAGTYKVSLTIDGEGTTTKVIFISDIRPIINEGELPGGMCEVKITPVELTVEVPNPQNLSLEYLWIFPEGTITESGDPIEQSTEANPGKVKFLNVGSQKVRLLVKLGGRQLEEGVVNVQVAYNQPVKTLYYAVKGGNIMAYKLAPNKPENINISPFDLGVKSGQHAFNLLFNDSSLYVLDAGRQYYYTNDVEFNLGDGRITVVSKDGKTVETMLSNSGGFAFYDPFYGYIDAGSRTLYFSDRRDGIAKINLDKRNETMDMVSSDKVEERKLFPLWVRNNRLGYYVNGMAFGAVNANFMKVEDVWWWSKTNNGPGIYTFKEADILSVDATAGTPTPNPYGFTDSEGKPLKRGGLLLPGMFVKSFVVDVKKELVYYVVYDASYGGFYKTPMSEIHKIESLSGLAPYKIATLPSDNEGSSGEYISVSQMVLDPEDGSVYFGFRTGDSAVMKSGVKRYNPSTNQLENLIDNVEVYGITINNTKSKLF